MEKLMVRGTAAAVAALALSGCASIVEGTDQLISLDAYPVNAACQWEREGALIAQTEGSATVKVSKSRHEIIVKCYASGHQPKAIVLRSEASAMFVASVLLVDFGVVDMVTGAANKYPQQFAMILKPDAASTLEPKKPAPTGNQRKSSPT